MKRIQLTGLVAAAHTPFHADGSLNLTVVERQAEHMLAHNLGVVFICGTTGESHSLTFAERRQLAHRWMEVARGTPLQVIVHVGANCQVDACALAAHAESLGARAIAALAPSYFKPSTLTDLMEWCATIAAAAPTTPFYYYDIPTFTGVNFSMPAFLARAADHIPTLNGIKFTNPDLASYQQCLALQDGAFDVPWGIDESLLAALSLGARGAVGSTYNFAAPIHHRLLGHYARGDLVSARREQLRVVQLVPLLAGYGYLGAAKALMGMLGVDLGPARQPNRTPKPEQVASLRAELEALGFFDWIARDAQGPSTLTR